MTALSADTGIVPRPSIQVGCTPEVMRRNYERLDGMAIAKRNAQRRLGPETIQMHSLRRAGDARANTATLDAASHPTQTAIA